MRKNSNPTSPSGQRENPSNPPDGHSMSAIDREVAEFCDVSVSYVKQMRLVGRRQPDLGALLGTGQITLSRALEIDRARRGVGNPETRKVQLSITVRPATAAFIRRSAKEDGSSLGDVVDRMLGLLLERSNGRAGE